jgi:hypothetical protein
MNVQTLNSQRKDACKMFYAEDCDTVKTRIREPLFLATFCYATSGY